MDIVFHRRGYRRQRSRLTSQEQGHGRVGGRIRNHAPFHYTPWANGTVECCCREVLRATSALRSELRLGERDWPSFANLVQSILNSSPLKRLGKNLYGGFLSPLEVFTGQKPRRPVKLSHTLISFSSRD